MPRKASPRNTPGLYKRGDVWWLRYTVDGKQIRESSKTTNKSQAEALLSKRKLEVWQNETGLVQKKRSKVTLGKLRLIWESSRDGPGLTRNGPSRWRRLLSLLGGEGRDARGITRAEITELKQKLSESANEKTDGTLGPGAVNGHLDTLSAAYNEAIRQELLEKNPVSTVRKCKVIPRDRVAIHKEVSQIIKRVPNDQIKDIITLAVETGMRRSEIVFLDWSEVDLDRRTIKLPAERTKSRTARLIPLTQIASEALKKKDKRSGRVFSVQPVSVSVAFTKATRDLGIQNLHFHDLRRTAATRLRQAGVDPWTIRQITGHKSESMALVYQAWDEEDLLAAVDKLAERKKKTKTTKKKVSKKKRSLTKKVSKKRSLNKKPSSRKVGSKKKTE